MIGHRRFFFVLLLPQDMVMEDRFGDFAISRDAFSSVTSVRSLGVAYKVQNQMQYKLAEGRHDLTQSLKSLQCKTLIIVGENSPFHAESVYMNAKMDGKSCALVEVQACGSLVTEEHPDAMLIPIEFFLMGFGYYRQPHFASSWDLATTGNHQPLECFKFLFIFLLKIKCRYHLG